MTKFLGSLRASAAATAIISAISASGAHSGSLDGFAGVGAERIDPIVVPGAQRSGPGTNFVVVPRDLCRYQDGIPDDLAARLRQREDFPQLLDHMGRECPDLALGLAGDNATASISAPLQAAPEEHASSIRLEPEAVDTATLVAVRVPEDLCTFDGGLPAELVARLSTRSDASALLDYLLENCPELALDLTDSVTEIGRSHV